MNYDTFSDQQLATLLCKGEREAFRQVYLRYWKRLYQIAERKVPKEIAEEIVQDIFVRLWSKRETPIQNLQYYLFSAVKYGILNHIKKQIIENKHIEYKLHVSKNNENTTDYDLLLAELQAAITQALTLLPQKTQQIFSLSRFDFLSHQEIAIQLNISEKAIEYHITQALKVLRVQLKNFF